MSMQFLLLSAEQAGDRLLIADLGRRLASAWPARGATLILHGVAVSGDLDLEIQARETTDAIARRLIEEGVSAVSLQGSDRNMLTVVDRGLIVSGLEAVLTMARLGAVPVISVIARESNRSVRPVSMFAAVTAIAAAAGEDENRAILFTPDLKKGLFRERERLVEIAADELADFGAAVDVAGVSALLATFQEVWVTNTAGLGVDGSVEGTRIPSSNVIPT